MTSQATGVPGPRTKDFWAGVVYVALGSATVLLGRDLPMGSAARMGPSSIFGSCVTATSAQ